ncbi:MAG: hypothetical protein KME59_09395 [Trichormus sp. ATA11-4-KO1]|nr:hypothetical protein [Trichormus sp. ATA11-4-KO1]
MSPFPNTYRLTLQIKSRKSSQRSPKLILIILRVFARQLLQVGEPAQRTGLPLRETITH